MPPEKPPEGAMLTPQEEGPRRDPLRLYVEVTREIEETRKTIDAEVEPKISATLASLKEQKAELERIMKEVDPATADNEKRPHATEDIQRALDAIKETNQSLDELRAYKTHFLETIAVLEGRQREYQELLGRRTGNN